MNPKRLSAEAIVQTCLDPVALQAWLQATLPACASGRLAIDDLKLTQARRSSSRQRQPHPLTFCLDVSLHAREGGASQRQRYFGKVYRDGASTDAVAHAAPAPLHLPQLDLLLWAFPADPGLPQLPALLNPRQTCRFWGQPARAVQALRHEPERRATLRYTAEDGRELYAKTFRDDRAAALYQRFAHFWARAQHDDTAPAVAEPLGFREETRSLWQAAAHGLPLLQALLHADHRGPGQPDAQAIGECVGQALAALHATPLHLAGPVPRDRAHWLQEVRRRRKKISRATPQLATRVERLADSLLAASDRQTEPPLSLIHGDCHPDQIWLQGLRPLLFDFDEFCLGDPMEDLAEFIIKLPPTTAGRQLAQVLPVAYARFAPQRFDAERLQWHSCVQHLLQASRAFVFQQAGWQAELERRLARAEALALRWRSA